MGFEKEASSSSYILSLPREDTSSPLLPKHPNLSSLPKTFANVFIAIVGSGVLGLPYTFKKTGWLAGLLMIVSVAALTYYCMMLLVYTRRRIEESDGFCKITSFGDLGLAVCGPIGKFAVDVMIVLSQAGFCVGYVMFIATTLANVFNSMNFDRILGLMPKTFYVWGMLPFQLGLNSIPTLTHLAPLSIFADVVDIGAMGIVMVEDVMVFFRDRPALEAFGGFSIMFYGIGVAVYAFEGIGMVLPLESEAADKQNFGKVLGISMGFISLIYGSFGALGYFAFGQATEDIITINFGKGLVSDLVQLGLCINLFFTFPLMMNPVHEVFEKRLWGGRFCLWLRWLVVLGVCLVALTVPNFTDFLSLVGSSVCIVLGFVLPALFHWIVFKEDMDWKRVSLDFGIMAVGVIFAVSGTVSSLMEIFSVKG